MLKHHSLRAALVAALPELARDPQNLKLFVDQGRIAARLADRVEQLKGFEYRYRLSIGVIGFTGEPDQVMVPLLLWLRFNQPELLGNHDAGNKALSFDADIIDDRTVDLWIELQLSEAVIMTRAEDGGFTLTHPPEPEIDPAFAGVPDITQIDQIIGIGGGETLYQRPSP